MKKFVVLKVYNVGIHLYLINKLIICYKSWFYFHSVCFHYFSRASVVDATGVLTYLDLEPGLGETSKFERKDVWAMVWASDNPRLLAIMEKTRMYVLRDTEPEEPILSAGYICYFKVIIIWQNKLLLFILPFFKSQNVS